MRRTVHHRIEFQTLEWFALVSSIALSALGAQQHPDTTARRDTAARAQALPPIVVTGSLGNSPTSGLGVARAAIDRNALNAEPARFAVEPLRHATGVHIDEADGPLGPTIIRLRGGDETFTQILFDGVQGNENGGFFDWQGLTLVNVDRIEVARGPQSTVYGTSAMTGAVQILTRAGAPGPLHAELTAEGARTSPLGGSRRSTLELSGGGELLRFSAGVGSAFDRGQFAVPQNLHSNDASMRVDLVPSGAFQLTGTARYMEALGNLPVRDPGATRVPLDPYQHQGRDRVLASLDATWAPTPRWTNRLTVAGYHLLFSYDDRADSSIDASKYQFYFFNNNFHQLSWLERTTVRYVGTVASQPTQASTLSVSYGGELEGEGLTTDASGDFGPSHLTYWRPNRAAFAEAELRVADRLSLVGGGRAESFRGIGAAIVPRATIVYDLLPGHLSLRAAAAGAYKAPNVQYQFPDPGFFVGNPNLRAETSQSTELGIDVTQDAFTGSATVFRQSFGNLIRNVQFDTTKQIFKNLGRSRASGVELDGAVHPLPRWTVGAGGAWTSTTVLDNSGLTSSEYPDGQPLPFRPAYTATAFVSARVTSALSILVRASAVGRQTVLSERFDGARVSIDPYHVLSGTATYRISPSFETYVQVENALDAGYETAFDKPGAPRVLAFGVRLQR